MSGLRERTDADILFRQIKNIALTKPYRSKKFMQFVRDRKPGSTYHHVFGSVHSLKSSDLLGIAAPLDEHLKGEGDREWQLQQIPEAIANLLAYVEMLESKHGE